MLAFWGRYPSGAMLGRDGVTLMDHDPNPFGQEWQVLSSEGMLFHDEFTAQTFQKCSMPDISMRKDARRRLGETAISEEDAGKACSHVSKEDVDACVFDVLATNDMDIVGAY